LGWGRTRPRKQDHLVAATRWTAAPFTWPPPESAYRSPRPISGPDADAQACVGTVKKRELKIGKARAHPLPRRIANARQSLIAIQKRNGNHRAALPPRGPLQRRSSPRRDICISLKPCETPAFVICNADRRSHTCRVCSNIWSSSSPIFVVPCAPRLRASRTCSVSLDPA
jgi:hypothetical protein